MVIRPYHSNGTLFVPSATNARGYGEDIPSKRALGRTVFPEMAQRDLTYKVFH